MDLIEQAFAQTIQSKQEIDSIVHLSQMDNMEISHMLRDADNTVYKLKSLLQDEDFEVGEDLVKKIAFLIAETEQLIQLQYMCLALKPVVYNEKKSLNEQMVNEKNMFKAFLQEKANSWIAFKDKRKSQALMFEEGEHQVELKKEAIVKMKNEYFDRAVSNGLTKSNVQKLKKKMESLRKKPKIIRKSHFGEIHAVELNSKQLDDYLAVSNREHDDTYPKFEKFMQTKFNIDEAKIRMDNLVTEIEQKQNTLSECINCLNQFTDQEAAILQDINSAEAFMSFEITETRNRVNHLVEYTNATDEEIFSVGKEFNQINASSTSLDAQIEILEREFNLWKASRIHDSDESDGEMQDLDNEIQERLQRRDFLGTQMQQFSNSVKAK